VSDAVLSQDELAAVATLWRSGQRELVCRFGGTSMRPAVPPLAEVRLRCGEGGALGDVIAFLDAGRVIVHRVVALAPNGWLLTRGDARLLPDTPVRAAAQVIGRVVAVRGDEAFGPVPEAPRSLLRACALAPLVGLMRISPGAGAGVIGALHAGRRRALALASRLRGVLPRLRGRGARP